MLTGAWIPRDSPKTVSWSGSPASIEAECEALDVADKKAEGWSGSLLLAALAIGFFGFFIGLFFSFWISMGSVLLAIVLGVLASKADDEDIEDRKLEVARTLVAALADELRPGRPVDVTIDFRGYWRYENGEPWLTVKMILGNGVGAQLLIRSSCKRKTRQKRKYTKIKDKIVETVVVRLSPPKGQTIDGQSPQKTPGVRLGPLYLKRAAIAPRAATFVYQTRPVFRSNGRGAPWTELPAESVPFGRDAVHAVVTSYHMLGRLRASSRPGATAVPG